MKSISGLIDLIDKHHKEATPFLVAGIIILLCIALGNIPSYDDYCKEPQARCKEK